MLNLKRIIVSEDNIFRLNQDFLLSLEEALGFFDWKVSFGQVIQLTNREVSLNKTYTNFNEFIKSWIATFEEGMKDPNIDYRLTLTNVIFKFLSTI